MKKKFLILFAAAAVCGAEKSAVQNYQFSVPLITAPAAGAAGRVRIPGAAFEHLSGLRIFDSEENEWPYFILRPADGTELRRHTPELINRAFSAGREPYWEFDLIIDSEFAGTLHNALEVITDGDDFIRRVEISRAGEDGFPLQIAAGYLTGGGVRAGSKNNTVSYFATDADRLHVRVYTNAKNIDETFSIRSVAVYFFEKVIAERETVTAESVTVPKGDLRPKIDSRIFDTGFVKRPIDFLTIETPDASFVRRVSVSGRNSEDEPWQWIGGGEISRTKTREQIELSVRAAHRWLRVEIFNEDNRPLNIDGILFEARARYLVFEAGSALPAALYFAGGTSARPDYDLSKRISESRAAGLPLYETGALETHQIAEKILVANYTKIIVPAVIGLVSVLTAWVIISMMRRQKLS